jgi:ubiquitin-activating enzyme E1-like protein 2
LRAENYKIAPADRLETKRIAGKIIPAIATTTAAVAGLVSIEFVKIFLKRPLASFKNTFMNLAFPSFVMSEPAECQKTFITKDKFFTLWDQWELRRGDILLQDFCKHFEVRYRWPRSCLRFLSF